MTHIHLFDDLDHFRLTDSDTLYVGLRALPVPRPSRWRVLTSLLWRTEVRLALPINALAIRIRRAQLVSLINQRLTMTDDAERLRADRIIARCEERLARLRQRRLWLRRQAGLGR